MPAAELLSAVEAAVRASRGYAFAIGAAHAVGGGCIDAAWRVEGGGEAFFVKTAAAGAGRFAAEADGLAALAHCPEIAVPRVVAAGSGEAGDFLVLEWLEIARAGDDVRLGEAVAALHERVLPHFGWHCDNFIGTTPQENRPDDDWPRFFRQRRLRPQLRRAAANGAPELEAAAADLLAGLHVFFPTGDPAPALLHGDLWRGNCGFSAGRPCLFDPAVHAGDPECDLAMVALFGGFAPGFFTAARAHRREDGGSAGRRRLYQLYHVLNHYNLFGGGYRAQALGLIASLTAELR